MQTKNKVFIFDISNAIHRAFHATGELSTSYGFPTGAVFGTLNMMLRFIEKYKPTHLLVCYDAQTGKSVRKDIYPLYKANRIHVNSVSAEEKIIRKLFSMMSIPTLELEGYEADDLIATACKSLKGKLDIIVVTGDKDLLQLVEPGVTVFDAMKNVWYDELEATKKFGVRPNQIADYLALAGDSSDNIPGGAGIGPKAASDLLSRFRDIEHVLADCTEKKYADKLNNSRDNILVSKKLTSLFDTLPVNITEHSVLFKPKDNPEIYALLERLEFKSLGVKLELMWQAYS